MWQNSKLKIWPTQTLSIWQNTKSTNVTKLRVWQNSEGDKTQKSKLYNSKTQNVTKKKVNCEQIKKI